MLKSELNFPLLTLYQLVQEINPISTKGFRLCLHNNTGTHGFSDLPTALIYVLLILGACKVLQHVLSLVKGSFFSKYRSKILILHKTLGKIGCWNQNGKFLSRKSYHCLKESGNMFCVQKLLSNHGMQNLVVSHGL